MSPAPHASRHVRWTAAQAKRHLAAIRDGDESPGAYCRRRGFSSSRLAYWRKRLGDDGARPKSAFVEITPHAGPLLPTVAPTAPGVTIRCAGGAHILVVSDFDPLVLRAVVAALS
jgi:hypothetical protein